VNRPPIVQLKLNLNEACQPSRLRLMLNINSIFSKIIENNVIIVPIRQRGVRFRRGSLSPPVTYLASLAALPSYQERRCSFSDQLSSDVRSVLSHTQRYTVLCCHHAGSAGRSL